MSSPDIPSPDVLPALLPAPNQHHGQLRDFLLGAFEREQYLQLLADAFGPEWIHKLPPSSYATLVHDSVLQMERERCVDSAFFAVVLRARPRRYEEIRSIAGLWGVHLPPLDVLRQLKTPSWHPWVIAASMVVMVAVGITVAIVWNISLGEPSGHPEKVAGMGDAQTSSPEPMDDGSTSHAPAPQVEPVGTVGEPKPPEIHDDDPGPKPVGPKQVESKQVEPKPVEPKPVAPKLGLRTPLPKLTDLEYVDVDGLSLEDKIAAQNGMKPGFSGRMGDIRGCYTDWTTVDVTSCPYEPFSYFTVWYDVTITEAGKIIEVEFKTSNMVRSTPDICVRDAWLLKVVKAPKVWKGKWKLRMDVPAPQVPVPGARGCVAK